MVAKEPPKYALKALIESLSTCVAWRCPDGTQFFTYWPIVSFRRSLQNHPDRQTLLAQRLRRLTTILLRPFLLHNHFSSRTPNRIRNVSIQLRFADENSVTIVLCHLNYLLHLDKLLKPSIGNIINLFLLYRLFSNVGLKARFCL